MQQHGKGVELTQHLRSVSVSLLSVLPYPLHLYLPIVPSSVLCIASCILSSTSWLKHFVFVNCEPQTCHVQNFRLREARDQPATRYSLVAERTSTSSGEPSKTYATSIFHSYSCSWRHPMQADSWKEETNKHKQDGVSGRQRREYLRDKYCAISFRCSIESSFRYYYLHLLKCWIWN